jgi:putative transposase
MHLSDRCELLEPNHFALSLRQQCELLGINRSNYYYQSKPVKLEELVLLKLVDQIYTEYPYFGSRQMSNYLRLNGHDIGRSKIRNIYEKLGLQAVCPGPHTSKPHPEHKVYPYLLRGVEIARKDQVWSTDITFLGMKKGFVYLVAIIDWFSRYVLDWEIDISLDAGFCIEVLSRALKQGKCEIFNSDQGSQFTSNEFINLLITYGIMISMDGKGRALDNIFVERLWRSVKYECIYLHEWDTVKAIKQGVCEYFNFYNYKRPHQSLNGLTPAMVYFN